VLNTLKLILYAIGAAIAVFFIAMTLPNKKVKDDRD
jgi:hypothetical protein